MLWHIIWHFFIYNSMYEEDNVLCTRLVQLLFCFGNLKILKSSFIFWIKYNITAYRYSVLTNTKCSNFNCITMLTVVLIQGFKSIQNDIKHFHAAAFYSIWIPCDKNRKLRYKIGNIQLRFDETAEAWHNTFKGDC